MAPTKAKGAKAGGGEAGGSAAAGGGADLEMAIVRKPYIANAVNDAYIADMKAQMVMTKSDIPGVADYLKLTEASAALWSSVADSYFAWNVRSAPRALQNSSVRSRLQPDFCAPA